VSGDANAQDNRISYVAESSGVHFFDLILTGGETGSESGGEAGPDSLSGAGAAAYDVGCEDTTLYGAFNTNANPFNFLELENVTTGPVEVTVTLINFDDSFESPTGQFTASLGATSRTDISIHDIIGPLRFGSLILSHNGPSGSVRGRVSQYRAGSDGGLDLSVSVPLAAD